MPHSKRYHADLTGLYSSWREAEKVPAFRYASRQTPPHRRHAIQQPKATRRHGLGRSGLALGIRV